MAELDLTNIAATSINTPAAGVTAVFTDSSDKRPKVKDENGVISTLVNDGLKNFNTVRNGGFTIQQRVATAATAIPSVSLTTRAGQVADGWSVTVGNVTTPLWTQVDAGVTVETGLLSKFYGRITQNTNAAKFILSQFVANEIISHLRGQKVRVSCKIKQFVGSNANYRIGMLQLTSAGTVDVCPAFISAIGGASVEPTWGTNLVAITPDASPVGENGTISGVALTVASTAAWVKSSCVFTVPSTALNLCVVIYRDTIGAASDSMGVAEVQLTQGTEIVDWTSKPFHLELLRCQRYFAKSFPYLTVPVANAGVNGSACNIIGKVGALALAVHIPIRYPVVQFKAAPTVTLFAPSTAASAQANRIDGTTPAVQTATTTIQSTDNSCVVTATGDAAGAIGDLVGVHYTVDSEFNT